jgi:hypothetical protein
MNYDAFNSVELIDLIVESIKKKCKIEEDLELYLHEKCTAAFIDEIMQFYACPKAWVYDAGEMRLTSWGVESLALIRIRWASAQAIALDIARTKIIPIGWTVFKKVSKTTSLIEDGKNIESSHEIEIHVKKGSDAIMIETRKNKIVNTCHYEM